MKGFSGAIRMHLLGSTEAASKLYLFSESYKLGLSPSLFYITIFDLRPPSDMKRVSTPWVSRPRDPGKRTEPVKGEFTF